MKTYQLRSEILAPMSLQETFAVFENPYNLAKITPPSLGFEILTPGVMMKKGAEIDYRFRWLGFPMTWRTLITDYEPPFLFEDVALKSPYAYWKHRHTFRPAGEGTVIADMVDYALPLGPLGRIVHDLLVHKQVRSIFEYRTKALEALLGEIRNLQQPVIRAAS